METQLRIAKNKYQIQRDRVDRTIARLKLEQEELRSLFVEINDLTALVELNKMQQIEENMKEI